MWQAPSRCFRRYCSGKSSLCGARCNEEWASAQRREGWLCRQAWRVRVRVEIMGSQKCGIVRKSQSILIMINPIIFTRTRTVSGAEYVPAPAPAPPPLPGAPGILRAERLLPGRRTHSHPTAACDTSDAAPARARWLRVQGAIMGPPECRIVGKSQPAHITNNPIISPRARRRKT